MGFLSAPFTTSSWVSWNTVASGLNSFCVQERSTAGNVKNEGIVKRFVTSAEDLQPFRIIYTTHAADFAAGEAQRSRALNEASASVAGSKSDSTSNNSSSVNTRSVVAVGTSLGSILEDWGWLMKAWPAIYSVQRQGATMHGGKGASNPPAPRAATLSESEWQPVYAQLQEMMGTLTDPVPAATVGSDTLMKDGGSMSVEGAKRGGAVAAKQRASGATMPAVGSKNTGRGAANASPNPAMPPNASVGGTATAGAAHAVSDTSDVYFNVHDAAVLQLCDLWAWRHPQLTATTLAIITLGGLMANAVDHTGEGAAAVTAVAGAGIASTAAAVLFSWPAVLCLLLCVALPVGYAQTHRRRAMVVEDYGTGWNRNNGGICNNGAAATAAGGRLRSGGSAIRSAEAVQLERQVVIDTRRLARLARLTAVLTSTSNASARAGQRGGSKTKGSVAAASSKLSRTNPLLRLAATPLGAAVAILGAIQMAASLFAPAYSPSALLNLAVAPAVALSLLATGAHQMWASFHTENEKNGTAPQSLLRASSANLSQTISNSKSKGTVAKASRLSAAAAPSAAAPATPVVDAPVTESLDTTGTAAVATMAPSASTKRSPAGTTQATSPSTAATVNSTNGYKYRLPALTDKESAVADQLTNYGAAYSMVLVKPLREWNQSAGWGTQWEGYGLRYEERKEGGRPGCIEVRVTANIPHTSVGTLEAVLLDDPDFLDGKGTCAYQYNPLLSQRCVVKRLAYNLLVLLTRHRSPVYGVPPLEMLQYVSPAILLSPEQQEDLGLRRPFVPSNTTNHDESAVVGASRPLMALVQCAIPCPLYLHPTPPCQPPHVRGVTNMSVIVGMEEADGSLTLGAYECLNSRGIIPSEWEGVYRSLLVHRAAKIVELLGQEGPQPNRLATYANRRDFQPYLDRQALSEPQAAPSAKQLKRKARAAAAAAAAAAQKDATPPAKEAALYSNGTALLTSDLELAMPSSAQRHQATLSGGVESVGVSPAAAAKGGSAASLHSSTTLLPMEPRLPKVPERFVRDLLTISGWTPEPGKGPVRVWSCQTIFSDRRAMRTVVFAPGVKLVLAEAVLVAERFVTAYNPMVERQVTVTPMNLPSLLANAVGAENGKGNKGDQQPQDVQPRPDFQRDSYHGCSIHYTALRSPMWGVAPRDTVTRVAEPYYFTAGDARRHLFTVEQLNELPDEILALPDSAAMFLYCGEDASDVLPPMKQYQRGKVILFGYLCWESSERLHLGSAHGNRGSAGDVPGVTIMCVMVMEAGGRLRGKLSDKSMLDQQQVALKMREAICKFSEESQGMFA